MQVPGDMDDLDTGNYLFKKPVQQNVFELARYAHRRVNQKGNWPYVDELKFTPPEVVLIGGGPTLNDQLYEIQDLFIRRVPFITVNGAYKWCLDHFMIPLLQIMVDARQENAKFNEPQMPGTDYLISDECHPDIVKVLPRGNTYLWDRNKIEGGSTVMLCAVPLLRLAGVRGRIHMFGFDSCVLEEHHAYTQPENNGEQVIDVPLEGRKFKATHWMVSQAEEFLELHPKWGDIKVYGDGLIAWMLNNC